MKQISFGIVIAALLVSAPRLTLAFVIGDGIYIPQHIEVLILTVTGIGSGVVLTIGNAVLAHALATKAGQRSALWWFEAVAWVLFLAGAVVLVSPTLVAGLRRSQLDNVLTTTSSEWLWSVTAVVIVELLVAAAMAAAILADEKPVTRQDNRPGILSALTTAVVKRIEASAPALSVTRQIDNVSITSAPQIDNVSTDIDKLSTADRRDKLLTLLHDIVSPDDVDHDKLGERFGTSARTIRRDIEKLVSDKRLSVNGTVKVLS